MSAPRLSFLIGGVQKGGTTALAQYLSAHPLVALPRQKEAHVFDAPDFDESWSPEQVDARFAPMYDRFSDGRVYGDATPITILHGRLIGRVAAYNPEMRWIILLRDPVSRAISHYHMEAARGNERRGLFMAVLTERQRLRRHQDDWSAHSPLRVHSYVARGRYGRQLDVLTQHFPRSRILLLRSADLELEPAACMAQVLSFLGLPSMPPRLEYPRIFPGGYRAPSPWSAGRLLLRWLLRKESENLRRRYGIALD